jgi:hypothetical protein
MTYAYSTGDRCILLFIYSSIIHKNKKINLFLS